MKTIVARQQCREICSRENIVVVTAVNNILMAKVDGIYSIARSRRHG